MSKELQFPLPLRAPGIFVPDDSVQYFGTGNDVGIQWDGTNLIVSAAADDSIIEIGDAGATQKSFDVKLYGDTANGADRLFWDASDSQLEFVGKARLNFTGQTGASGNTDGQLIAGGSSAAPVTNDTANSRFISLYTDCGATSGSSYGYRHSHYITGAAGSGAAMRGYCNVKGVTGASAYGGEFTVEIDDTASSAISGEASGLKAICAVQNTASGTLSALLLGFDVASGKDASAVASAYIRCASTGDGTASKNFLHLPVPGAKNSGNMFLARHADATATHSLQIVDAAGTNYWFLLTTDTPAD